MLKSYSKVRDYQCQTVIILTALVVICMATRLLFMGRYLEGWDSVDFALGLHDYDVARYQPHFPGYPVYIFLCWLADLLADSDVLALTIPGAVFGGITLVPLFYLARSMFAEKVAWLAAILYVVNPLCWLQSEKALSDAVGLFFIVLSAQLLFYVSISRINASRYLVSGSVMLGICLGVRLSYFPFVILWLYTLYVSSKSNAWKKSICYGVSALIIGICVWLIPLSFYTGLGPLVSNGLSFAFGHFSDWGGSVATSQNIIPRASGFVWCLFCNGCGFWCYDTSAVRIMPSVIMGIGIIFYFRHLSNNYKTRFIAFYTLPYFLWVFFGQNLEKPRHVLPLIPVIIICISVGLVQAGYFLDRYSYLNIYRYRFFSLYRLFIGIFIVSMSIISVKVVDTHKNRPIAQVQLLDYVWRNYDDQSTRIYCWETKRLFDYYSPSWDTRRVRDIDDLLYDVGSSPVAPDVILSTSKVNGISSIKNRSKAIVEFKNDRYVNNPYHKLTLYDLSALK